uniref:Uncharacterized protein n=1 Tax=Rhizophora mucronata TaxID=61149 RepID=A0A2P2N1L3_RHIMU
MMPFPIKKGGKTQVTEYSEREKGKEIVKE